MAGVGPDGWAERKPRRRGRGCLITMIVFIVVVLVLLVVADRVGVSIADKEVAKQVANKARAENVSIGKEPTADITGFPFLTQVVSGSYDKVIVHLQQVGTQNSSGQGVTLPKLDITATGVHAPMSALTGGSGSITADRMGGTATVSYAYVSQLAQAKLGSGIKNVAITGKDGKLQVSATVSALGQDIPVAGTATASVSDNVVNIKVDKIAPTNSSLPSWAQGVLDGLAGQMSTSVSLGNLPYGLKVNAVTVGNDGLSITAATSGSVTLAR